MAAAVGQGGRPTPSAIVPNPPNTERSPSLVLPTGAQAAVPAGAVSPAGDVVLPRCDWPLAATTDWPPLRCTPSLQAPQGPLVEFLTSGYGYDDQSVASAVRLGNEHFARRKLDRAIDFYGAAYEIGRLHFDYKPLMHDLVLRRVICYSMLGDMKQALHETELALRVIPHSASVLLYQGILHSKLGHADEANQSFQMAVAQCRELRNLIDCIVALFMLAQGHCDRAIQVCSQVLTRQPRYQFALLVRGDAYKFHASGYFSRQAADDYTMLLEIDIGLQPLIGERLTPQEHARFDELVLQFHPRLQVEGPQSYDQYPMCAVYRKRRPFLVAALLLFAVAKLKTCVRSTQLVQNVQKRNEELLQARAAAERKVRQLVETQQKLAALESSSFSEVWGPADPDHCHVRKYRRYWMERPLGFPRRNALGEPAEDGTPPHHRCPSPPQARPPQLEFQGPHSDVSQQSQLASPPMSPAGLQTSRLPAEDAPALFFSQQPAQPSKAPPVVPAEAAGASVAASAPQVAPDAVGGLAGRAAGGGSPLRQVPASLAQPEAAGPPVSLTPGGGDAAGPAPAVGAADLLLEAAEPSTPPHPTAQKLSTEHTYAERPPPQKLGHDWSDREWLSKALELADAFGGSTAAAGPPPEMPSSWRADFDPPPTNAVLQVPGEGEVNLAEAIERYGFDVIPDWFTPLDRVYEISDMSGFQADPEPFVAPPGLAGAPGYSYVVQKNSSRRYRLGEQSSTRPGDMLKMAGGALINSEALLRRYQDRLLQTSLPGPGHRDPAV